MGNNRTKQKRLSLSPRAAANKRQKDGRGGPGERKPRGGEGKRAKTAANAEHRRHKRQWEARIAQTAATSTTHTVEFRERMLHTMLVLRLENPSWFLTNAVDRANQLLGVYRGDLFAVYNEFMDTGEVTAKEVSARGRGAENYNDSRKIFTPEHLTAIDKWIEERRKAAEAAVTVSEIAKFIEEDYGITCDDGTILRALKALGYIYMETSGRGMRRSEESKLLERKFLIEYAAALKKENEGRAVIFYMDESYVHQNHVKVFLWVKGEGESQRQRPNSGRGQRLIIVHAITKHGPVVTRDANGNPVEENSLDGENISAAKTAELIFKAKSNKGDYHDNMDGEMFMQWLNHRLLPTVTELCKSDRRTYGPPSGANQKEKFLVLDNARYHHAHDENYVDALKMSKDQCLDKMLELNLKTFKVSKTGKVFDVKTLESQRSRQGKIPRAKKNGGGGPSGKEMQAALHQLLLEKFPEKLQTRVEKWAADHGWTLIFTAPYKPKHQPIELFWADGKNTVAYLYKPKRKLKDVRAQLRTAWYGGTLGVMQQPKEATNCAKLIAHAQKEMNLSIKDDGKLRGTITDLGCDMEDRTKALAVRAKVHSLDPEEAANNDESLFEWNDDGDDDDSDDEDDG